MGLKEDIQKKAKEIEKEISNNILKSIYYLT